jgi:Na+/proline symporter
VNGGTLAILGYVALQLVIGYFASRNIRSERDYLLAGRKLGPGLVFFSVFATWFGAETCIGAAGEAYASGLSAVRADPFGYATCLLLMALILAVPLWKRGFTTLGDLFRERFGPRAEKVAVLVMVPSSVMWAGAQVRAFGQVLSSASGAPDESTAFLMTTVAAAVVIIYTAVGGMMADAVSDLVQGSVLIVGLVLMLAMAFTSGDLAQLGSVDAAHFALVAEGESFLDVAESWAVPIFGSLVAQELVSRVVAARSPQVARTASLVAAPFYLMIGVIPVIIGLLGSVVVPDIADPEHVLPATAARYFSPVMLVIFQGALVSAILSTVDTTLLVSGSLVAHNLYLPLRPNQSEAHKLLANRIAVAGFGVIAYGLALSSDSVYELVEAASAFGSAGILVCTLIGLFSSFGGERTALATLITGVGVYAVQAHLLESAHPFLSSVGSALAVYVIGACGDGSRKLGNAQPPHPTADSSPCPAIAAKPPPDPSSTSSRAS